MSSAVRKVSLILSFSPLCPLIPISPEHLYEEMYNSYHCDMSFHQKGKKIKNKKISLCKEGREHFSQVSLDDLNFSTHTCSKSQLQGNTQGVFTHAP